MSFATMQILNAGDNAPLLEIRMQYIHILGRGIWACVPGYLGATRGYWDSYVITPDLDLFDDDDDLVARCWDVDGDWLGYPLSGHEGRTGMFSPYRKGVLYTRNLNWKLLSV